LLPLDLLAILDLFLINTSLSLITYLLYFKCCYSHIRELCCHYFSFNTEVIIATSIFHSKLDNGDSLYYVLTPPNSRIYLYKNTLAEVSGSCCCIAGIDKSSEYMCSSTKTYLINNHNATVPLHETMYSFAPAIMTAELMLTNVMMLSVLIAIFT